jgi:hypothetical protein
MAAKKKSKEISTIGFDGIDTTKLFENIEDQDIDKFIEGFQHYKHANLKAENGEFRGDFTRETFNSCNTFSKVLSQQGRVQLDTDLNEQTSITTHQIRNLACDIGSEHWGPYKGSGFALSTVNDLEIGFYISPGHYYVNGILCEIGLDNSGQFISYANQPDYPLPETESPLAIKEAIDNSEKAALVYLDVWERHYTYINDDSIREVALGGPDTATRAKIIWQVKILTIDTPNDAPNNDEIPLFKKDYQEFLEKIVSVKKPGTGKLCAKVKDKSGDDSDPCLVAPESRYRGAENQLYRVEIHTTGVAEGHAEGHAEGLELPIATYKWSRENSSVIFPIASIQDPIITLEHLGKDCRYGLKPNDWVELIDDDHVLQCRDDSLFQVESIDKESRQVTLSNTSGSISTIDINKHAYLRRWDHVGGGSTGIPVVNNSDGDAWLDIEDGIQVQFKGSNEATLTETFKTGDYWLIPARTITGNIEWPVHDDQPQAILPHGVVHHYAPLAILNKNSADNIDLRRILIQTWA